MPGCHRTYHPNDPVVIPAILWSIPDGPHFIASCGSVGGVAVALALLFVERVAMSRMQWIDEAMTSFGMQWYSDRSGLDPSGSERDAIGKAPTSERGFGLLHAWDRLASNVNSYS